MEQKIQGKVFSASMVIVAVWAMTELAILII